jgi:hypothetical protein
MAKHNCAICGVEVGLLSGQKLADGNYICRKVCSKKTFKIFDKVHATLDQVNAHIAQVEFGTKAYEQIFVPLKKTKVKEEKLKSFGSGTWIEVSPSTGLIALPENRYKIFIFGKTTLACVYRIADLYGYEYEEETEKNSDGKEEKKSYCRLAFRGVQGLNEFRIGISGMKSYESIVKYFDTMFGIQKTLGNSINNAKKQMEAFKAITDAVKATSGSTEDQDAKREAALDAMDTAIYGDRTELIAKADEALAKVS